MNEEYEEALNRLEEAQRRLDETTKRLQAVRDEKSRVEAELENKKFSATTLAVAETVISIAAVFAAIGIGAGLAARAASALAPKPSPEDKQDRREAILHQRHLELKQLEVQGAAIQAALVFDHRERLAGASSPRNFTAIGGGSGGFADAE